MTDAERAAPDDPFTAVHEFEDGAAYAWWRNAHPSGFVLAVRARKPAMLHRTACGEIDRDLHAGRLGAKGSRQLCAETKAALRAWMAREQPEAVGLLARCPKCGP